MVIDVKPILRAGLTVQAAALALKNVELIKDKKKTPMKFIKTGVTNIVGISLLRPQAAIIEGL